MTDRLLVARQEYKRERDSQDLRTELLFVVYGKEAPTLSSVSRRLGVSRTSLVDRWPGLCKAISARYLQRRREMNGQRVASVYESARRIARELDKQGVTADSSANSGLAPQGLHNELDIVASRGEKGATISGLGPTLTKLQIRQWSPPDANRLGPDPFL